MSDYKYIGDRFTDQKYKGLGCSAVRRNNAKQRSTDRPINAFLVV